MLKSSITLLDIVMDTKALLKLYPDYDTVYGPYTRKDGRKHLILSKSTLPRSDKTKNKTISYPKALKEIQLNKVLLLNETVDHDDRDFTNDNLSNLIIRERSMHSSLDAKRVIKLPVNCIMCNTAFIPSRHQREARSINKAGPFCSKKCSGKYGKSIQNGGDIIKRIPVITEYFRLKK